MNPDIERLAKEAGLTDPHLPPWTTDYGYSEDEICKFAALIAEECAAECDLRSGSEDETPDTVAYGSTRGAEYCATAIRQKFPMPGEQG